MYDEQRQLYSLSTSNPMFYPSPSLEIAPQMAHAQAGWDGLHGTEPSFEFEGQEEITQLRQANQTLCQEIVVARNAASQQQVAMATIRISKTFSPISRIWSESAITVTGQRKLVFYPFFSSLFY
jgi:hypothetical protein